MRLESQRYKREDHKWGTHSHIWFAFPATCGSQLQAPFPSLQFHPKYGEQWERWHKTNHWLSQGLWNILGEAFGFYPNLKFCRKSSIKRQSWEAADKLINSTIAKDTFKSPFYWAESSKKKKGIKCSNAFSDLSRKYQKWFAFYWCNRRPLKMGLSWLGNTFFDTSGAASIRKFSSKREQITIKTYLHFSAFHSFIYFTLLVFSRDWLDWK